MRRVRPVWRTEKAEPACVFFLCSADKFFSTCSADFMLCLTDSFAVGRLVPAGQLLLSLVTKVTKNTLGLS